MEAVLTLPMNAIALDNDEMEYVDGGVSAKVHNTSIGFNIDYYLNSTEANKLAIGGSAYLGVAAAATSIIPGVGTAVAAAFSVLSITYGSVISWYNADGSGVIVTLHYAGTRKTPIYLGPTVEDR
ncbi:MAG TPA: hypothetical protein VHO66_02300 [Ruminiclostridium sp.]|nr:hypothetical protein [Ruminiclostridium sp.]